MSSQQVTLHSLMMKWKSVANQQHYQITLQEIESLFAEATDHGISLEEMSNAKTQIANIWCSSTWQEAQSRHPHWKIKSKYDSLRANILKHVAELIKAYYPEHFKPLDPTKSRVAKKEEVAAPVLDRPKFTSKEEADLWKSIGKPATNKEWQAWKAANPDKLPKDDSMSNVRDIRRSANGV